MEHVENIKSLDETTDGTKEFYSQHGWEGSKFDPELSLKDIAKNIREYVKEAYPTCKFSVTMQRGNAMTVALMEAPQSVFVPEYKEGYKQLNQFVIEKSKVLNEYGISLMSDVNAQIQAYNYDDSDVMRDDSDRNFYHQIHVGKWDRDFKVVEQIEKVKEVVSDEVEVTQDTWIPVDEIEKNPEQYSDMMKQREEELEL